MFGIYLLFVFLVFFVDWDKVKKAVKNCEE